MLVAVSSMPKVALVALVMGSLTVTVTTTSMVPAIRKRKAALQALR